MLVFCWLFSRISVILQSATLQIVPILNKAFDISLFSVPDKHLPAQSSTNELIFGARVKITLDYFRGVLESLQKTLPSKNVPNFDCLVPGRARQTRPIILLRSGWAEANAWNGCFMATQHIQKLPISQTPQIDVVWFKRAGSYDIATCFNCKTAKLGWFWGWHRPEILILD